MILKKSRLPAEILVIGIFLYVSAVMITAAAFTAALLCVGTANAGFAALSGTNEICNNARGDNDQDQNDDCIFHNGILMDGFLWPIQRAFPFSAYSAFIFFSVFLISAATTAAMPRTATRPAIAMPAFSEAGEVIRVPMV